MCNGYVLDVCLECYVCQGYVFRMCRVCYVCRAMCFVRVGCVVVLCGYGWLQTSCIPEKCVNLSVIKKISSLNCGFFG